MSDPLDTFDEFIDDMLSSEINLLKGELDLLLMQHIFNSIDLDAMKNHEEGLNDSLAA